MKESKDMVEIKKGVIEKVKLLVFGIVHEMLKYQSNNYIKFIIFNTVSFIQIMYFAFHPSVT